MSKLDLEISKRVIGNVEVNSINARELHKNLEVKTPYYKWVQRKLVNGDLFEEGFDYILVGQKSPTNNPKNPYTNITSHIVTLDTAKHISLMEKNQVGHNIRKYFINIERQYTIDNNIKGFMEDSKITGLPKTKLIKAYYRTDINKERRELAKAVKHIGEQLEQIEKYDKGLVDMSDIKEGLEDKLINALKTQKLLRELEG